MTVYFAVFSGQQQNFSGKGTVRSAPYSNRDHLVSNIDALKALVTSSDNMFTALESDGLECRIVSNEVVEPPENWSRNADNAANSD